MGSRHFLVICYDDHMDTKLKGNEGFLPIVIGLIVSAIIAGTGAYYIKTHSSQSVQSSKMAESGSHQGWKTYSSGILAFQFPADLELEEREKGFVVMKYNSGGQQKILFSIDARLTGDYADYGQAVSMAKKILTGVQTESVTNGTRISGRIGPDSAGSLPVTMILYKYGQAAVDMETNAESAEDMQLFNSIAATISLK